ncbi:class I SAM-dependent DNA methyltransferase [bacterium]|nr:class I SAM-dependent DNA methyltransferase [bacterium]
MGHERSETFSSFSNEKEKKVDLNSFNTKEKKAKKFAEYWKGKGYEKGESQIFWISLLQDVFGVEEPTKWIKFEEKVFLGHTSFIDGYIPETKVLIEQKALGKDLTKPIKQSDGTLLSPFQQAKRYITELPLSKHPRFVVTCNFEKFLVYDMENPKGEPEEILLENLEKDYYRLSFLVETENIHLKREMELSIQAGEIVGLLYDEFLKQYIDPTNEHSLKSLNMLCVRLVFCLYAEDAGIFGHHSFFHDYLSQFEPKHLRKALIDLFQVLDTEPEKRDPYLDKDLKAFPYVNGGLFNDENIEIPQFTEKIKNLLLAKASDDFNWAEISPTIFGAVFESTLNPETRRSGGMHYTSIENIHKVIDPLFLDDLKKELEEIKAIPNARTQKNKLKEFQHKLASLKFLDPACGSGNFLTETYMSLRNLENEALAILFKGQVMIGAEDIMPIEVSISQFYGIEINDFAVTVAKTALWIAESQMMKKTESIIHAHLNFLPLKSYANIIEANALKIDWKDIIDPQNLNYIMGNPPFVGKKEQTKEQKAELTAIFDKKFKGVGVLDYVTGWYKKASDFINNTNIQCAFVSTNSITQGEQVPVFGRFLQENDIKINFAYRSFKWNSEAKEKAGVHCVIIGFSKKAREILKIYPNEMQSIVAENINPYLVEAPSILIENRKKPICNVPEIKFGSMPVDGGNLILEKEDVDELLAENPANAEMIREFLGAAEFLQNKKRWCLWLKDVSPEKIKKSKIIMQRIKAVAEFRRQSTRPQTVILADTPTLFGEIRQPDTDYLLIPRVSSENRRYIPIDYISKDIISSDANFTVSNASLYTFGVLTSNVHMSWMRTVGGRLKSDYRYSGGLVYNNFPWCSPSEEQKAKIEKTAQDILNARALYPDCSLADLYDELTMPPELRKAHQENDRAVMRAYCFPIKETTESACVAKLMKMYQELTK